MAARLLAILFLGCFLACIPLSHAAEVSPLPPSYSASSIKFTYLPVSEDGSEGKRTREEDRQAIDRGLIPETFNFTYQPVKQVDKGTVVGLILSVQGRVLVISAGGEPQNSRQAVSGQTLFSGDTIATQSDGRIRYQLNDESIMTMAPESRMVLKQSSFVAGESRISLLNMDVGKVRFAVKKILKLQRSEFRVNTPTAVVGVRGSEWDQVVTETSTQVITHANTTIEVSSIATPEAPPTIVNEFERTEVVENRPPSTVERVQPEEIGEMDKEFELEAEDRSPDDVQDSAGGPVGERKDTCQSCHAPIFKLVSLYFHRMFKEDNCLKCHVNFYNRKFEYQNYAADALVEIDGLLPAENYEIFIDHKDTSGNEDSYEFSFTPSATTESLTDVDGKGPLVSGVEVKNVIKGIFADVVLAWRTDKWSMTQVEYGPTTDYGNYVMPATGYYFKDHRVAIDGLANNGEYHFRIISTDPFGHQTTSDDYLFSTVRAFDENTQPPATRQKNNVNARVVIFGGTVVDDGNGTPAGEKEAGPVKPVKIGVIVRADYPVQASVECNKEWNPNRKHEKIEIKPFAESGLEQCLECHPRTVSHKVNIKDYRIPDELPTAEGKVMICSTCHSPHGTSDTMGLRSESIHQLCLTCHVDR